MNNDTLLLRAVQAHPHLPVLATSGIESTIKIWSPGEERLPDPRELVQSIERNQVPSQPMLSQYLLHALGLLAPAVHGYTHGDTRMETHV